MWVVTAIRICHDLVFFPASCLWPECTRVSNTLFIRTLSSGLQAHCFIDFRKSKRYLLWVNYKKVWFVLRHLNILWFGFLASLDHIVVFPIGVSEADCLRRLLYKQTRLNDGSYLFYLHCVEQRENIKNNSLQARYLLFTKYKIYNKRDGDGVMTHLLWNTFLKCIVRVAFLYVPLK